MKLDKEFFTQDSYNLAISLLGKVICIKKDNEIKKYRIVETEAYGGITDKAAHSYNNKRTPRTEVMYKEGGYIYIYLIYGMYYLLNFVASVENNPDAVLIRAVEPIDEIVKPNKTNGPGKLCKYMGIDKSYYGIDVTTSSIIYVEDDGFVVDEIVKTKRINIDYAEEDKDRLWRFYIKGNKYISIY